MTDESNTTAEATADPVMALPDGEYAIVEMMGKRTLVGRVSEVEQFGAKFLALEPLFNGTMLPAVMIGGPAIYCVTPCSAEVAAKKAPKHLYQLPPAVAAVVPQHLLPPPDPERFTYFAEDDD